MRCRETEVRERSADSRRLRILQTRDRIYIAVANALRAGADVDRLFVSKATVDKAPNRFMRRWRPRAMGRATRVTKGVSHIHIELDHVGSK